MLDRRQAKKVFGRWGIESAAVLPGAQVQGSPERSLMRTVVQDVDGNRYVLEQLDPASRERKTTIADRIDRLARAGLPLIPYLKGINGAWIQTCDGFCWQLSAFVEAPELPRKTYWMDAWRGACMGRFIADLSVATRGWTAVGQIFSLPLYIEDLMQRMRRYDPHVEAAIAPIADFLRRHYYPVSDSLAVAFCHGDPHPVNTIWERRRIIAVIDWEFCGWKPALYDAALIVGCVGSEAPEARTADFVRCFLQTLRQQAIYPEETFDLLPLLILAVRFGWLSEWLRRRDAQMIAFEQFYMTVLMDDYVRQ